MSKDEREKSVSLDRDRASSLRCDSSHMLHSYLNPNIKECEEARCPVCMEHPHNSILLICSSYENGCRPYMCDTSYQHSNCFNQFYKASKKAQTSTTLTQGTTTVKLTCPFCRGDIKKWVVIEAARCLMNSKLRSCSWETCDFNGTYSDLREHHARVQHPSVRSSEADPVRQSSWRMLEHHRDREYTLSNIQFSFDEETIYYEEIRDFLARF